MRVALRLPFAMPCDPFGKFSLGFPTAGGSRFYLRRWLRGLRRGRRSYRTASAATTSPIIGGKRLPASEPASAKKQARSQRCEKNWQILSPLKLASGDKQLVECRAAGRRAEVAVNLSDCRKTVGRDTSLFRQQPDQSRVWLVRGEADSILTGDTAAPLYLGNDLSHLRNRRARQCVASEYDIQFPVHRIFDLDGLGKLRCAAEEEFTQTENAVIRWLRSVLNHEGGRAVAKKPAKFSTHAFGSERPRMDIRSDDKNSPRSAVRHERLCRGKRVEQA